MSKWESSRTSGRRDNDKDDQHTVTEPDSHQEDQWKALTSDILGSSDDEQDSNEAPANGDLSLPQLPSRRPKAAKRARKEPVPKKVVAKQKTLAQSMSDNDMERLFNKYREEDIENEESAVDFRRFLQDDDDEGMNSADGADGDHGENVEALLGALGENCGQSKEDVEPPQSTESGVLPDAQANLLHVPLQDLALDYSAGSKKEEKSKAISVKKGNIDLTTTGKTNYLSVEVPQDHIELARELDVPSAAVEAKMPLDAKADYGGLFYWLDAKEQHHSLSVDPGSLFLFGRVPMEKNGKRYSYSCCLRVQNVRRCIHLLPKPGSTDEAVLNEVNTLCRNQGIADRLIGWEEKYYAFEEPGVPHEKSRWVSLRYPGKYAPLAPKDGMRHITTIMGASQSLLELFLIEGKIKGPCFLRVSNWTAAVNHVSHCDLEYIVNSPQDIVVDDAPPSPPPLTLASLQIHAQLDPSGSKNEVFAASLAVYRDADVDGRLSSTTNEILTGIRQLTPTTALPVDLESAFAKHKTLGVKRFQNERSLLIWLVATIKAIDPDMLIGHNFLGFSLDTILRRCQELDVPGWSSLGRLDLKRMPRLQGTPAGNLNQEKEVCVGRLVGDSYLLSREYFKSVNYKLSALAEEMHLQGITKGKSTFEPGVSLLTADSLSSSQSIFEVLLQVTNYAVLAADLVFHLDALRLTKRLTTIAGNLWSRTLYGARSERIEYLLLHSFSDLGFIVPDKKTFDYKRNREEDDGADDGKRKAKYQGGMVLDPKCGLYSDYILLLDFNSLYPSLIQEFNICYTTVDRTEDKDAEIPSPENLVCESCRTAGLPSPCKHKCILPKVIKGLVDSRREVKQLMQKTDDKNLLALLEIRQKALKLTANSMYGCLGFEHSRFHAQPLAELVTRQGRMALQNTVDIIPQFDPSLRVIYGDTDSVMIQTGVKDDIKKVRETGLKLKTRVNMNYKSLEIDIDGVFRAILLLKKKKYAAISVVDWQKDGTELKREVKGLDMVRRDWCPLSKKVSDAVLSRVLNAGGAEEVLPFIVNYMLDVAEHVRAGDRYSLDDFVISKSLTKEPESYKGTSFPHAEVAKWMKEQKMLVRVGDLIPYVICKLDNTGNKPFHVEEVRRDTSLRVDTEWYLSSQILPPVVRLCEHIQGFSSTEMSVKMGIATRHSGAANDDEDTANHADDFSHLALFKSRELSECFPTAVPLQVQCTHCLRMSPIDPHKRVEEVVASDPRSSDPFDLYLCTSCGRSLPVLFVANSFNQTCYSLLRQFYQSGGRSAAVRAVRLQFTYFRALFDAPHAPGCIAAIKDAHYSRARRCVGLDRRLYTLAEAETPDIADAQDPVDPLRVAAESFYKRIDHLFINLDELFAQVSDDSSCS